MTAFRTSILICLLSTSGIAQTIREWTDNGGNNSWNNSSNWTDSNLPDGTNESAGFVHTRNAGKKAYVTNEGGTIGLTRNLSGLSFLGDDSGDNWRLYAKQGEVSSGTVTLRLHDTFAWNLVGGSSANIYCGIEVAGNVTCNMNGAFVVLHHGLSGSSNLTGSSSAAIDGNGGLTLKSGGGFSGTFTSGKGTIDIDNVNALQHAIVNLNDSSANRLVYINDSKLGNLTGNGKLTLANNLKVGNDNADSSFTGPIDGSGSFEKMGDGTLTLTGNHTHTGLTKTTGGTLKVLGNLTGNVSVNSGKTLELGNGGTGGDVGDVASLNGTIVYDRSSDETWTGISGSGDINKYGTGTLTLYNDNSNLGTIRVYEGSVAFNKNDSGPITLPSPINNASHVHIEKSGNWLNQYSGLISGVGSVTFKGGQTASKFQLERDQTYTGLTTIDSGTLKLGIGGAAGWVAGDILTVTTAEVHFNRSDNRTFSGNISGNGKIYKYANSTLTLSGTNTITGTTEVEAGTLRVNGSLASTSVIVNSGTTLGGNGSLAGSVSSTGTVAPGNSTGTLGMGALNSSGTLVMEIDGASADQLTVTNLLDIASTTLDFNVLSGGVTEPAYLLASYGSLNGPFSSVQDLPSGYVLDYAYHNGVHSNHIALVANTPPSATSIVPRTTGPTKANSLVFDVGFDLDVVQFDSFSDLIITSPGNGASATGATITGTGDTYVVTLTGVSGNGNLQLSVGGDVQGVYGAALDSSVTSSAVVIDNSPPLITLNGDATVTLSLGENWNDPGATASDNIDTTVTVTIGGDAVLPGSSGTYTITYDASDTAGNAAAQKTRTVIVLNAYHSWTRQYNLTGNDAFVTADPDNDGRDNRLEFGLDGDPTSASNDGKLRGRIETVATDSYLVLTAPTRDGLTLTPSGMSLTGVIDGILYRIQGSIALDSFDQLPVELESALSIGMPPLNDGWSYRSFRLDGDISTRSRGFLRIEVSADN
ncbi:immunoglobulin-like domain-containing protein [Haloferula sp.]|uniref:immunoglobulin-like domain-containing protein n=1 Tax=Haloferula sp. TaxID=2497595 RepID=UPI00329F69C4